MNNLLNPSDGILLCRSSILHLFLRNFNSRSCFLDQPDEDELTQDYPEQFLKPLKKINKPPKKKAEDENHDAKAVSNLQLVASLKRMHFHR